MVSEVERALEVMTDVFGSPQGSPGPGLHAKVEAIKLAHAALDSLRSGEVVVVPALEIRECVQEIMADDGDFAGAVNRLLKLVGGSYPAAEAKCDPLDWRKALSSGREEAEDG